MTVLNHLQHVPASRRGYLKRLIALGLTVTLGFSALCGYILWENRNRDRDVARQFAANLVQTISSEIERNLELYDLSLQAVVDGMKLPELSQMSPELRGLLLFDRAATAKGMGSIFILDKNGNVTLDSRTPTPTRANYAQTDFFKVQSGNPNAGTYLSRPWRDANGEYLLALSRRLSAADGSFAGVVVGTLQLSYLRDMFHKLKLGDKHALTLVRDDGSIVLRDPYDERIIGRDVSTTPIFQRVAGSHSGWLIDTARIDGVERMYVFQRVGEQPLRLAYGQSLEQLYAAWRHEAWRFGLLMLALCATNIALVVFLARALKRRSNAEHQLAILATTDSLTSLCNRRRLDEVFEIEWRRTMRTQTPIAVLMIDADHFKAFNDEFGHQAGDTALVAIAHCIVGSARRAGEICARYGGEEFVVLLPGVSAAEAFGLGEDIRARVLALRADQQNRADSCPTVSIGVAAMVPRQGLQPRDLIKAADTALYRAKSKGRNCVEPTPTVRVVAAGKRA